MSNRECLAGVFVGGRSSRMAGVPKGLLQPPGRDSVLVECIAEQLQIAGLTDVVLVGNQEAYRRLVWPMVPDSALGEGPLAGLLGLVEHALRSGYHIVLAIACDMARIDARLIHRLCNECGQADALVPRREHWEPLCARYRAAAVVGPLQRLLSAGERSMQSLLLSLGERCVALPYEHGDDQALMDWDAPRDLPEGVRCPDGSCFTPAGKA